MIIRIGLDNAQSRGNLREHSVSYGFY
jgi:hypothetical protein